MRHHGAYILFAAALLLSVGSSAEAATISLSPAAVNFGDCRRHDRYNHGHGDFHTGPWFLAEELLVFGLPAPFFETFPSCDLNTCIVDISFSPTAAGAVSAAVEFLGAELNVPVFNEVESLLSVSGTGVANTPLPATLPLFATGFGVLGLLGWRRKRQADA